MGRKRTDKSRPHIHLTRRERQIMDVLYSREEASAGEIHEALPDRPSYSAVRALLRKLLDKQHVSYRREGARYIYAPVMAKQAAEKNAVQRLIHTFFNGQPADAVVGLLGSEGKTLSAEDLDRIEAELKRLRSD